MIEIYIKKIPICMNLYIKVEEEEKRFNYHNAHNIFITQYHYTQPTTCQLDQTTFLSIGPVLIMNQLAFPILFEVYVVTAPELLR